MKNICNKVTMCIWAMAMAFPTSCSDGLHKGGQAGEMAQTTTRTNECASSIDEELNHFTDTLLASAVREYGAYGGLIAVVETQTGRVKAASSKFHDCKSGMDSFHTAEYSTMGQIATVMAALENGDICMDDSVDTGCGMKNVHDRMLRDHNWIKGGYGTLTLHEAVVFRSSIGAYLAAENAFAENITALTDAYRMIGYDIDLKSGHTGEDTDFAWTAIGYNYKISSWNTLQFVNAIANGGKCVPLTMVVDSIGVEQPRIAKPETIEAIRSVFEDKRGYVTRRIPDDLKIGAVCATSELEDVPSCSNRKMEVCGYFPTDNPQYTVYLCIYKKEYPYGPAKLAKQLMAIARYIESKERD